MSRIVYRKDELTGGYIAFRKQNDGIVSQGTTKKKALANLRKDTKIVMKFKKDQTLKS